MDATPPPQEVPQKNKGLQIFNIFIVIGAIIALLWILYLTNLPLLFNLAQETPGVIGEKCSPGFDYLIRQVTSSSGKVESYAFCSNLSSFQQRIGPAVFIFTIIYLVASIANFYMRDKKLEWNKEEAGAIILKSDYERIIPIRTIAKEHYGMNLGKMVKSWPIQAYSQQQAISPVFFYLFENLNGGRKPSYSLWYEHYAKKITTHLASAEYFGFANKKHFWTGEPKQEITAIDLTNSLGVKKGKEINAVETEPEGSMTG